MRTLIINLTRFGDLLQPQPVLAGLAAKGARPGLACLSHFSAAAELLRHVDYVTAFPDADLLRDLDAHWGKSLSRLEAWRDEVRHDFDPNCIVNLTATLSSRLLARLLTPENGELVGFGVDNFGFGQNDQPWTAFLQASTRKRGCSPYNLADVFRKVAAVDHITPEYKLNAPGAETRAEVRAVLDEALASLTGINAESPCRGLVAFQLGASDDRRRWPTAHFARLGAILWQKCGYVPLLLGAKSERHLAERFAQNAKGPFIDLIGGTNLPGLAAALLESKLLVTNDTGTMHLAAGLNVPVLAIFLATAQPWDTGPYQENMCCLEPDLPCHPCPFDGKCDFEHKCRQHITPEAVFSLAARRLERGEWAWTEKTSPARIWLTMRNPKEQDPAQFLDLKSLSGHEGEDRTKWLRLQRLLIGQFLDQGHELTGAPVAAGAANFRLSPELRDALASETAAAVGLLHLLQEQGRTLLQRPLPPLKNKFLGTWQRLQTLWDTSNYFNMLGFLWLCETQTLGDDFKAVLALAGQYRTLLETWRELLVESA